MRRSRTRKRKSTLQLARESGIRRVNKPVFRLRNLAKAYVTPKPVRQYRNLRRQIEIYQQIGKRPSPQRRGNALRIGVHPTECTRRKHIKKQIMKGIASAARRASGTGGLKKWRRTLSRYNPRTKLGC